MNFCGPISDECKIVCGEQQNVDVRSVTIGSDDRASVYVNINTLAGPGVAAAIEWVKNNQIFDIIVFSCATDMHLYVKRYVFGNGFQLIFHCFGQFSIKFEKSELFEKALPNYRENLNSICEKLATVSITASSQRSALVWISPFPPRDMQDLQSNQFKVLIDTCHTISKLHQFHHYDCFKSWPKQCEGFFVRNGSHCSGEG
jgi:hypothetical protein